MQLLHCHICIQDFVVAAVKFSFLISVKLLTFLKHPTSASVTTAAAAAGSQSSLESSILNTCILILTPVSIAVQLRIISGLNTTTIIEMGSEDNESHRRRNASRFVTLGSRNLMEQVTAARGRVDIYFGKVRISFVLDRLARWM